VSFLSPFDLILLSSLHVHYIPTFLACIISLAPCIVSFVFRFSPYIYVYTTTITAVPMDTAKTPSPLQAYQKTRQTNRPTPISPSEDDDSDDSLPPWVRGRGRDGHLSRQRTFPTGSVNMLAEVCHVGEETIRTPLSMYTPTGEARDI